MANRRSGGMGGGLRGNRSFSQHQPFQGNPWQGPNSMNQGLISSPQQLALALSNLLQPQQQMNNPPSLLSLNTSPGFSDQDRNFNRFGNRGRELRRHEPYSKNRGGGGWRDRNRGQKQNKKKDEKKDDKNENEEKKEGAEGETVEGTEGEKTGDEKENGEEDKDGIYHGVPKKFLNCFVCHKEMWDGESMKKHVRGRAHRQMLDTLEESIHLTVNILREHLRLSEEKKIIEFNRMQRVTRKVPRGHDSENHCNMCDLKFMGKLVAHRKTEGHQRLKRYLHPKCTICDKEFPSRIEWVEHRLTPEHLRKLQENLKDATGEEDGDIIIEEGEPDLEPILEESLQLESEFPIFELTDDLSGLQNLIPAYKSERPVCKQSLKEFSGFRCELCHRSFENEELAQKHLKSKMHYYSFIGAAKHKYKEAMAKKEREERAEKERLEKEKAEQEKAANENGDAEMGEADDKDGETDDKDASEVKDEKADNTTEDAEMLEDDDVKQEIKEEPKMEESPSPARQTRNTGAAVPVKNEPAPATKAKRGRK